MSFQAMAWAVKQKVGNATGKAILLMLANYADEQGKCWPSQETLAAECECSVATVARWLNSFAEMGFLTRVKQYGEGGYRRADVLQLETALPVRELPITKLPSTELPNSGAKLTRHSDGAEPITEPIRSSSLRSEDARPVARNDDFELFWSLYPNKVGKRVAEKSFVSARKRVSQADLMAGLAAYVGKRDDRPWCNPSTWLNGDRWEDQPAQRPDQSQSPPHRPPTAAEILRNRRYQGNQTDDDRTAGTPRLVALGHVS